jgi:type I restriction enzyme M protein
MAEAQAIDTEVKNIHGAKVAEALCRFGEKVSFVWAVADLLRGSFKAYEYGKVILPFTVLRRLDQVLASTRDAVWAADDKYAKSPERVRERMLLKASGHNFYNTSKLDFAKLLTDPAHVAKNLGAYISGFSQNARDIVEKFALDPLIDKLDGADLLYLVLQKFNQIDLHPDAVSNLEMGYVFEELIRRFAEQSNETAGEHFTPREVIRLMVNLLFVEDDDALRRKGVVRTMYDPACGTGGMLSVAQEYLGELNPDATLQVYGQELNPETYAVCKADTLIKGQQADQIRFGNSFSEDGHPDLKTDYLISNPPFGVEWTKAKRVVENERAELGHAGRFGPGLPRKNDGSLLFLLHMLSKMRPPEKGGSRLAVVFNGSPLFTGTAGSGESEIRRYLLENDLLEAIVALPGFLFYNTGINTYLWIVTNRKPEERRGRVQLVSGVDFFRPMRRSLGEKRRELSPQHIEDLTRLFATVEEGPHVKIFDNEDFGYQRITVERPLRLDFQASNDRVVRLEDEKAWQNLLKSKKKKPEIAAAEIEEGRRVQRILIKAINDLEPGRLYLDRKQFLGDLSAAMKAVHSGKGKGAPLTDACIRCEAASLVPGDKLCDLCAEAKEVGLAASLKKAVLHALSERNEEAEVCRDKDGNPEPDTDLRDHENVPLKEEIADYMDREVLPHVPDAWVDESKTKIGYEIPFTRHFYEYTPPRPLAVIEQEIRGLEDEIRGTLGEVLT